jgi:hypothetical protein
MIYRQRGDEIQAEKIILEAGKINICPNPICRSQGHRGKRAVGKTFARAFIDEPFSYIKPQPIK